MKLKLYSLLLVVFCQFMSFGQTLDANNSPSNSGGGGFSVTPTQNVGQSFLAGLSGPISQINVYFNNTSFTAGDFRLTIYNGDGYGGAVLGTQNFTMNAAPAVGEYVIPISSTINVTAGNMYTMRLDGITGSGNFLAPSGDPYANGILYYGGGSAFGSYDLWFKTFVTLPAQGTHLNFDGSDDYVSANLTTTNLPTSNYTHELWFRSTDTDGVLLTATNDGDSNVSGWDKTISLTNGKIIAYVYTSAGNSIISPLSYNDGNWHHVAHVSSSTQRQLFVDGTLVGTSNVNSGQNLPYLSLGVTTLGNTSAYQGDIEEVRIWTRALPLAEIQNNMNCELQGNETGLVAYYTFNQGIDASNNTSITSLINAVSGGINATLTNFTLTGATSNWLAGSIVTTGSTIPNAATVSTPVTYNQGDTANALTATSGGTGLMWYTTATGGTGSATAPTPNTATVGNTSYWVSSTNSNGCESARTEVVVSVNGPATHLNFDGSTDDLVNLGDAVTNYFTGKSAVTLQAWVKPELNTGLGVIVGNYAYPINAGNMQMLLRRDGTSYVIYIDGDNGFTAATATNSVVLNTWQHVSATWDGVDIKIYVDGVIKATVAKSGSFPTRTNSFAIGGNNAGTPEMFKGSIDEVRIWDIVLSESDILNTMNCELQAAQTGLIAYYKFNQGFDSANNATETTLTNSVSGGVDGSLINFDLTGSTSNWLSGSPVTTGSTCTVLSSSNFDISENIKIYPNPANNIVNIETTNLTNATLEAYDMNGRLILNQKLTSTANSISISQIQSGIYVFKIKSQEGETVKKVIKK